MANEESEKILLTEEETWSVLEFARALNGYSPFFTPDTLNARMKQINLNPIAATEAILAAAMKDPKSNEETLQGLSQTFELTSMVYKRLISYYANMLSFDITYTSSAKKEEYATPRYKKALDIFETFLYKFDYKKEFRSAVREMLRNDAYFGAFFDLGNRYILQELPPDYCKITGRWEGGLLFSFNFDWFNQPGVDIETYPDWFRKKYLELYNKTENGGNAYKYDPALPIDRRGKSYYMRWVDIPPEIGACFKFSPELATRLPYFAPLFNDLILQPTMRAMQQNLNMSEASKIIIGEVPLLNRDTKATVRDSIAISPELLGRFLQLVKSGVSESVKIASAPLQNFKAIDFEGNSTMYDDYLRTTLALSGVNTNLIFSSNVKPNVIETQLSLNVDEQLLGGLYEQFEEYLAYQANLRIKSFEFYIKFEGTEFSINRDARFQTAMSLFDKGIVLPQKIAAALGMKPSELRKHMEESAGTGFMDLLTPPSFEQQKEIMGIQNKQANDLADKQAKNQMDIAKENQKNAPAPDNKNSGKDGAGRPQKRIQDLTDEGASTRASGANIQRGGEV